MVRKAYSGDLSGYSCKETGRDFAEAILTETMKLVVVVVAVVVVVVGQVQKNILPQCNDI